MELIAQYIVLGTTITLAALNGMIIIAISHSFIVLSFFNMIKLYEAQSRERQIRIQNEHMLMLISNLYEESVLFKKTRKKSARIFCSFSSDSVVRIISLSITGMEALSNS